MGIYFVLFLHSFVLREAWHYVCFLLYVLVFSFFGYWCSDVSILLGFLIFFLCIFLIFDRITLSNTRAFSICVDLSNALSPPVICTGRVEPTCLICLALRVSTIAVFPGVPLAFMARHGTVETPSGEGDHLARYVS